MRVCRWNMNKSKIPHKKTENSSNHSMSCLLQDHYLYIYTCKCKHPCINHNNLKHAKE